MLPGVPLPGDPVPGSASNSDRVPPPHWSDGPATICPSLGRDPTDGSPLVTPLVPSTSYAQRGLKSAATHRYSRESNPTVSALERAIGDLEESAPALCFATGLAAESALFQAFLTAGDHVVCSRAVYGGTTRLLEQLFTGFGVETTFVDTTDLAAIESALRPQTRLLFLETPANPTLDLTDITRAAALARAVGALVAVDNTFLTPILQRPLELGADFSVYSTTKLMEGHSVALGGAIVARDPEHLERLAFVRKCIGNITSPWNAWLTLQGLKTLPVRLARQCETASQIATLLDADERASRVFYPTLGDARATAIATTQHRGAHGAVVTFEIGGGLDSAVRFLDALELCRLAEHVGSIDSLLTHPATMTHGGVSRETRRAAGISDGLVRLSVGLEPAEAIWRDLDQALCAAKSSPEREAIDV